MHICVVEPVVTVHRVEDGLGLLRRCGRVEVDEPMPVDLALKDGKIGAQGTQICHERLSSDRYSSYPVSSITSASAAPPLSTIWPSTGSAFMIGSRKVSLTSLSSGTFGVSLVGLFSYYLG